MTELENLSAQLEIAVKMQENAERLYHKSSERIEEIKMQMLEVNEKTSPRLQKSRSCLRLVLRRAERFRRCVITHTERVEPKFLFWSMFRPKRRTIQQTQTVNFHSKIEHSAVGAQRQPLFMPFSHNWQCSRLITG